MSDRIIGRILRRSHALATSGVGKDIVASLRWLLLIAMGSCLVGTQNCSAARPGPIIHVGPNKLESYTWNFSRANDTNFDTWPDGWERYRGSRYPEYIQIGIESDENSGENGSGTLGQADAMIAKTVSQLREYIPTLPFPPLLKDVLQNRYLKVELDGGMAMVQSSPVHTSRIFQYQFSCRIKTTNLRHDSAFGELVFFNNQGVELARHVTESISGTRGWTELSLKQIRPPAAAASMVVRLRVKGSDDGLEDIKGSVCFDDVRIEQFPQLQVTTDEPFGVYQIGRTVVAKATVMGLPVEGPQVRFRLFDSDGKEAKTVLLAIERPVAPLFGAKQVEESPDTILSWKLPRLGPGYYRVTAALENTSGRSLATETSFVVIDQLTSMKRFGSFGWTLPDGLDGEKKGTTPKSRKLAPWLAELGVSWLKFPCWFGPDDRTSAEEAASLFGRLQDYGINTIGILDMPPESELPDFNLRGQTDIVAARLFRDKEIWQAKLEPVMTRLTLKVRQWQLGADGDTSFLGRPRLNEFVRDISRGLQGFGQELDVALSWPWAESMVSAKKTSWQIVSRTIDPPLTASELDAYLKRDFNEKPLDQHRTWLTLNPLDKRKYSQQDRIIDLVLRMAAVRSHRVEAAFVTRPRDPNVGVLMPDGRPGEMLLPWRTTASLIGDLHQIGSLKMRSGATTIVLAGEGRVTMMAWSPNEIEEQMFLGDDARRVDVWGKAVPLPIETAENGDAFQRLKIGPVPAFFTGIDPILMQFRMSIDVGQTQLDSLLGQSQDVSIYFANPTIDNLMGQIQFKQPTNWTVTDPVRSWDLPPRRDHEEWFDVVLGPNAIVGDYDIPISFELLNPASRRITVYRTIRVGPPGLELKSSTRLTEGGDLLVQIELTNESDEPRSYDCKLYPGKDRQYETLYFTVQPKSTKKKMYVFSNGEELIGSDLWLKATEESGRRILNYIIHATK